MSRPETRKGFESWRGERGHPIARFGEGSKKVLNIPGLSFTAELPTEKEMAPILKNWLAPARANDLDFWSVGRRGDLPTGTTAENIADEYAEFLIREMAPPVGVLGLSTGGAYAIELAIRHPDVVGRLVLGFTTHVLAAETRVLQRRLADLSATGRWRTIYAMFGRFQYPRYGRFAGAVFWMVGPTVAGTPANPSVLPIDVGAEESHDATARLDRIKCPTLVISGERDSAYPPALVREMVAGIPAARHIEFPKLGHDPSGPAVATAVCDFLGRA